MKMKFLVAATLAVLVIAVGMMAGCATSGGSAPNGGNTQLTPAQVVQVACPSLQMSLTTFQETFAANASDPNSVKIAADIAKAEPVVTKACSIGANIDASNVAALANTALPALSELAGYLNLPADKLQTVRTGLLAAQVALSVANVVEANIQAAQAAKSVPAVAPSSGS